MAIMNRKPIVSKPVGDSTIPKVEYTWDDLFRDMEELEKWSRQRPKRWQFRKYRKWLKMDPRKKWH